ncbi:MAG: 2-dehydropantoate 2-reductase [Syntrophales bacterium]|nr:2-dehydropantoate 2-reductase [Syntrophales bacterium]
MKIAIVGIGGVGGYFGGKLARQYDSKDDHQIFFVVRGPHLEKIKESGLEVTTQEEGTFVARPAYTTDNPEELGPVDVIILCVKGYGLDAAARIMANNIHDDTVIITLLNGVDNAERLKAIFNKGSVLNGCVYISSRIVSPGKIQQVAGPRTLIFGPENGSIEPYKKIESVLKNAGIKATLSSNIKTDVWTKFVFMDSLAGITSMTGKPFGGIMEDPDNVKMVEGLMREVESLAKAHNVFLPDDVVRKSLALARNFPYETKSSLQLDFEKRKQSEIETFTGYVVKSGTRLNIKTPFHDEAYAVLQHKQKG